MYTYHNFFGTFIILSIQAVQSIQKQYGPPCKVRNRDIDNSILKKRKYWCLDFTDCT